MIEWLFCKVLRPHLKPRGHNPQWCLYWHCDRCGQRQVGELARRRRVKIFWATAVRDGELVGDLHAWRGRAQKSVCGRRARSALLVKPNFPQERAARDGCPSCVKALARSVR